ncbi:MAG: hypothetical protein KKD48_04910 [Nanoarchaeota archaeon]|nr:hypothetical protein [Nanoarchaeota archaeon]
MNYNEWLKKNKKTLTKLKKIYETEMKTKINLLDFTKYMYKETTHYKKR